MQKIRMDIEVGIDELINISGEKNNSGITFSHHVDSLIHRILHEENLSKSTVDTIKNDAIRIKEFFATIQPCDIDLEHVNGYINKYHNNASANVQNRKVLLLKKLFDYAVDESIMLHNPAEHKKMKKTDSKKRQRLKLEWFVAILNAAKIRPQYKYLKTAMELALQTAQAVLEVSRIQYKINSPCEGICGFVWFDKPQDGIYGKLYIHRQKVAHKEAAHVSIPVGEELKRIVPESRDNVLSPYVVHRLPDRATKQSQDVTHFTQLTSNYLSRAFSNLRDEIGICDHLQPAERPTFHEIRALVAHLFEKQGINPQARMAHSDIKSTKIYTQNHIDWVEVPHAQIAINS